MANAIDLVVTQDAIKQVENLVLKLKEADKELLKASADALALSRQLASINTPSGLGNNQNNNAQLTAQIQQQAQAIAQLQAQITKLTAARQRSNQTTAEEAVNNSILNRQAMQVATINSTLAGAYQRLSAEQARSATAVQNLVSRGRLATQTQRQYNQELERAQRDFTALNTRVLAADRAVGRFNRNVGNYPMQAARGIRDLLGAFGVVGGLALVAGIAKDIYKTTKEIQSLDLALRQVTGTNAKFSESQAFLNDISEKFGIEINGLTKQFTQFYVSAKDKISGKEINDIFESVAKSAGFMGLSVDAQNRAFVALNQMMSKGTVTAEELKGQLGEALPGAFGIMAKSMGTTEAGLGKLMKDGKVLAADVLPKFAKELEKAYGIENKDRVDSLAASQTRLQNSWTMFVRTLNESPTGGISQFFSTILSGANAVIDGIVNLNKSLKMIREEFKQQSTNETSKYLNAIKNEDERAEHAKLTLKDANTQLERYNALLTLSNKEQKELADKPWYKMTVDDKKQVKILQELIEDYNVSLGTQKGRALGAQQVLSDLKPKEKQENDGDGTKPKKEHIKLNFDYIKSEFELKKAIIERQLAQINDDLTNEESTLESRLKHRKEFSEKSMELMLLELNMAKAINSEKTKDDKEKNTVAYHNKTITAKEYAQNIEDINRNTKAVQGSADVAYSEKYRELINSDLDFYKDIEDKKREFTQKTKELILTTEKDKYKKIADNEDLLIGVRQKAWEEYRILVRKEMDLNKIKELAASKSVEETNFILEKYKTANAEFDTTNAEDSPQAKRMRELTAATKEYFKTIEAGFLDKSGLGSLNFFTQLDEHGQSTFDKLIEGAQTTGEKMAIAFNGVADVAQEVFSKIDEFQEQQYQSDLSRLESQKDLAIGFAGESATAKAEIERQYEERRKKLDRQRAKEKKDTAIFNAVIDTAQAVVSALAVYDYASAILFGIIGAAQIATISSQPLPAYEKGGTHTGGMMLVNDGKGSNYQETIVTPDGKIIKPTGRNVLMDAPAGTEIFTHDQWQQQLNVMLAGNGINNVNFSKFDKQNNGITESQMRNIISNMPTSSSVMSVNVDEKGFMTKVTSGGQTRQIMNARLRTQTRTI
jgi:tape measure domain-containing protein